MPKLLHNSLGQDKDLDMQGPDSKGALYKFTFLKDDGSAHTVFPKYSDNPQEMIRRYADLFRFYNRFKVKNEQGGRKNLNPFTYSAKKKKEDPEDMNRHWSKIFVIRPAGRGSLQEKRQEEEQREKVKNYMKTGIYELPKKEEIGTLEDAQKETAKFKKYLKKREEEAKKKKTNKSFDKLKKIMKPKKPVPPEGEQMSLFASDKNRISRVLLRYASWEDNDATLFWDEIDNQNIEKEDAKTVLDTADKFNLLS